MKDPAARVGRVPEWWILRSLPSPRVILDENKSGRCSLQPSGSGISTWLLKLQCSKLSRTEFFNSYTLRLRCDSDWDTVLRQSIFLPVVDTDWSEGSSQDLCLCLELAREPLTPWACTTFKTPQNLCEFQFAKKQFLSALLWSIVLVCALIGCTNTVRCEANSLHCAFNLTNIKRQTFMST